VACIVPEISLPYVDFGNWIPLLDPPTCGPISEGTWQPQSADIRAALASELGAMPNPFSGDEALMTVRFRLYVLDDTPGDGWWIDDITVTDP
jgi:hypothetical protein